MAEFLPRVQEANRAKPSTGYRRAANAAHLLGSDLLETLLTWGDVGLVNFACKRRRGGTTIAEISADVEHALTWIRSQLRASDFDPASVCPTLLLAIKHSWRNKRDAHTKQERDSAQNHKAQRVVEVADVEGEDGERVFERVEDLGVFNQEHERDAALRSIANMEANARKAHAEGRFDDSQLAAAIAKYDARRAEIRAAFDRGATNRLLSSRGDAGGDDDPAAGTRVLGEATHTPAIEVGAFQLRIAQ